MDPTQGKIRRTLEIITEGFERSGRGEGMLVRAEHCQRYEEVISWREGEERNS